MNLEDLKTYWEWARRATAILSRKVDPIGTEKDLLDDVIAEVRRLRLRERDVDLPGISRAQASGLIYGAVAYFRDKVKKDIMPAYYAKDDNIIIEPLYRPKIFNMTDFTVSWSGVTPPGEIDLLAPGGTPGPYNLNVDKEIIILTDIVSLTENPAVTELKLYVDGEEFRPVVPRKSFLATNFRVFDLPFPVIADINLRIKARVESASGSFTYLPIGIHVCLGSIHAKSLT